MPRENAATKAQRYLCEGRVILTEVARGKVAASVRGEGAIYRTGYNGEWWCTCPAVRDCCHVRALRRVTAPEVSE
jgi:uncharacterized Zn finger protein